MVMHYVFYGRRNTIHTMYNKSWTFLIKLSDGNIGLQSYYASNLLIIIEVPEITNITKVYRNHISHIKY